MGSDCMIIARNKPAAEGAPHSATITVSTSLSETPDTLTSDHACSGTLPAYCHFVGVPPEIGDVHPHRFETVDHVEQAQVGIRRRSSAGRRDESEHAEPTFSTVDGNDGLTSIAAPPRSYSPSKQGSSHRVPAPTPHLQRRNLRAPCLSAMRAEGTHQTNTGSSEPYVAVGGA